MSRARLLGGLFTAALLARLLVSWADYGFVASDDHDHVLADAVPAQRVPGAPTVVETAGVRSPVPRLPVFYLARLALGLGIEEPVDQVRWIYGFLGGLSMLSVWLGWLVYQEADRHDWGAHAVVWLGFHFLAVFVSTRALTESMSAPFLTLSGVALVLYVQSARVGWLLGSLLALSVASVFRFQAGMVVLALVVAPLAIGRYRDLAVLAALGVGSFLATGWVDLFLRGEFHGSLRAYVAFNLEYSSEHGVSGWYNYALLLFAATLPPLLLSRYKGFPWQEYRRLV